MGLIWSLILGAIAGFIATGIMHENTSWIKNILLGIVGGFVGGLVFRLVGMTAHGRVILQKLHNEIRNVVDLIKIH